MFDVGFGELAIVGLVGLYVIKPKHFPAIARLVTRRVTTLRQAMYKIKAEFKAEVQDLTNPKEPNE